MANMSVTMTHDNTNPVKVITLDWISDDAAGTATKALGTITGKLIALVTKPSGGGTAPTNLYDITITDAYSIDVLQGVGADRSSTLTQQVPIVFSGTSAHPIVRDVLTLNIAAAGNAKQGTVKIYYEGA